MNTTPLPADTVCVFKLKSGEEIIGSTTEEEGGWVVKRPLKFAMVMTPQGPQGTFVPFSIIPFEVLGLDVDDTFGMMPAPKHICDNYMQATTGIAVAQNVPTPPANGGRIHLG